MIIGTVNAADTTKKLFVLIDQRTFAFDFSEQQTILDLKKSICHCKNKQMFGQDFQNITPEQIILHKFNWKSPDNITFKQAVATLLQNHKTCAKQGLKNGSIITLALSTLPKRSLSYNAHLQKSNSLSL